MINLQIKAPEMVWTKCFKNIKNMTSKKKKQIVVAVSGYFNPLHIGHLRYLQAAKKLGTKLSVIVNSDYKTKRKYSFYDRTRKNGNCCSH